MLTHSNFVQVYDICSDIPFNVSSYMITHLIVATVLYIYAHTQSKPIHTMIYYMCTSRLVVTVYNIITIHSLIHVRRDTPALCSNCQFFLVIPALWLCCLKEHMCMELIIELYMIIADCDYSRTSHIMRVHSQQLQCCIIHVHSQQLQCCMGTATILLKAHLYTSLGMYTLMQTWPVAQQLLTKPH